MYFDSSMIFNDTYFAGDLSKTASENISFQVAKSIYLKVGILNTNIPDYY